MLQGLGHRAGEAHSCPSRETSKLRKHGTMGLVGSCPLLEQRGFSRGQHSIMAVLLLWISCLLMPFSAIEVFFYCAVLKVLADGGLLRRVLYTSPRCWGRGPVPWEM